MAWRIGHLISFASAVFAVVTGVLAHHPDRFAAIAWPAVAVIWIIYATGLQIARERQAYYER